MDPLLLVSALLVAAVLALVLVVRYYQERVGKLGADLEENGAARRRLAVAQSRVQDSWAPVLSRYPLDPRGFRYVGGAFDGIQVLPDRVVLVEFTGGGRPGGDPRVRDLVRAGRVEWLEVPLEPQPSPAPVAETRAQEGLS